MPTTNPTENIQPDSSSSSPSKPKKKGKFPLWKNIIAMILLIALYIGGAYWLTTYYTDHGKEVTMPSLSNLTPEQAIDQLEKLGLTGEVRDSVYSRKVGLNLICGQSVEPGAKVKQGRNILLTINSDAADCLTLPDIADNSSFREATARLTALGFVLTAPEYIEGEKDWVYAVKCNGRNIAMGTKVRIDTPVTLVVGSGYVGIEETEIIDSTSSILDDIITEINHFLPL